MLSVIIQFARLTIEHLFATCIRKKNWTLCIRQSSCFIAHVTQWSPEHIQEQQQQAAHHHHRHHYCHCYQSVINVPERASLRLLRCTWHWSNRHYIHHCWGWRIEQTDWWSPCTLVWILVSVFKHTHAHTHACPIMYSGHAVALNYCEAWSRWTSKRK